MNENSKLLIEYNNFVLKRIKDNHILLMWIENEDIKEFVKFEKLKLLKYYEIKWSDKNYYNNYNRLIKICKNAKEIDYKELKNKKLLLLIFKNVDKKDILINMKEELKYTNKNLIELEKNLQNNLKIKNYILSYDFYEFNALAILCLGYDEFKKIDEEGYKFKIIKKDLEGTNGWNKLSELCNVLNYSCKWLVLRNYEDFSNDYFFDKDDDIDMLCENIEKFTAIMNAKKREGGRCAYFILVNKMKIPLDIRFIGDKYYDPVWEKDMLERRKYKGIIPVLSEYDYFFSLLYHIKLQKKFVKKIYVERLDYLKKCIGLIDIPDKFIYNDKICADLLNSFLLTNNYHYTYTDNAIRNEDFVRYIKRQEINDLCSNCKVLINSLAKKCKKEILNLPKRVKNKVLRVLLNHPIKNSLND